MKLETNKTLKRKPDNTKLGFGKYFTDYMISATYTKEKGWINKKISKYKSISLEPSSLVFHYAQETFEGLKAYKNDKNEVFLFRPEMNARRFQLSNQRMCMPTIEINEFVEDIIQLIKLEKDWIPTLPQTSLYIRPFMFASEHVIGVKPAIEYKYFVICSPVGIYHQGFSCSKLLIETNYVRAIRGGTGAVKCGANYAIGLLADKKAKEQGYDGVLWLDGIHQKYIEECGTMNCFVVINDEIITPPAGISVLEGITRDSTITILKDKGYKVSEKQISIDEIITAHYNNSLKEIFGTGTAAVISPVGTINYQNKDYVINNNKVGEIASLVYNTLTGIQQGKLVDKYNYTIKI